MKPYEGFIFICGGPSGVDPFPQSLRDGLQRELVKHPLLDQLTRLAEHYKDWSREGTYADLLDFEEHMAELSAVIVLILESPGSIAELGLFTAIEPFREKLLVVMESHHYAEPSFIRLGPIEYLEKTFKNTTECHRWRNSDRTLDYPAIEEVQADLVASIQEKIRHPLPSRKFSPQSWRDCALLACELISIFSALTFKEIQSHLADFGAKKNDKQIHQLLYILIRLDFIYMEPKGTQRFYISRDVRSFVNLEFSAQDFDLMRFRQDVLEHYEKADKKRHRAILEVRRREHD